MTHEAATTARELPEALPAGEHILWQDAPHWKSLFRSAFHGRTLSIYFAVLLLARAATVLSEGGGLQRAGMAMLWLAPLPAAALGVLALISWLSAKKTWYTITNRRLVMRMGIVLEITFNFPFRVISSAALHLYTDGTGDIPVTLATEDRIAYLHLWPHVRPGRFKRTEPMMRALPNAGAVAELLARALTQSSAQSAGQMASQMVFTPVNTKTSHAAIKPVTADMATSVSS